MGSASERHSTLVALMRGGLGFQNTMHCVFLFPSKRRGLLTILPQKHHLRISRLRDVLLVLSSKELLQIAGNLACMEHTTNAYKNLPWKTEGERTLGEPRRRWKSNIWTDFKGYRMAQDSSITPRSVGGTVGQFGCRVPNHDIPIILPVTQSLY